MVTASRKVNESQEADRVFEKICIIVYDVKNEGRNHEEKEFIFS